MALPSTQALRALDSFVRQGSVWKAAEELNLTRSAVSHQLRLLERELGFVLLQRRGRSVVLTARGRRYASRIREALALIGDAGADRSDRGVAGPLVISCISGFASLWLCPHIGEFQELYPEITLRIQTPRRLEEVSNPEADLFIAFGYGDWPGHTVDLLSEVEYTPVCSPALLNRLGGFEEPADLQRACLLHLDDFESWTRWFALAGVDIADPEAGVVLSDKNLVLSAAIAGQGIALGDELTCSRALAAGQIVRPFDLTIKTLGAYYLVMESRKALRPAVAAFRDWLRARLEQAATTRPNA